MAGMTPGTTEIAAAPLSAKSQTIEHWRPRFLQNRIVADVKNTLVSRKEDVLIRCVTPARDVARHSEDDHEDMFGTSCEH